MSLEVALLCYLLSFAKDAVRLTSCFSSCYTETSLPSVYQPVARGKCVLRHFNFKFVDPVYMRNRFQRVVVTARSFSAMVCRLIGVC